MDRTEMIEHVTADSRIHGLQTAAIGLGMCALGVAGNRYGVSEHMTGPDTAAWLSSFVSIWSGAVVVPAGLAASAFGLHRYFEGHRSRPTPDQE